MTNNVNHEHIKQVLNPKRFSGMSGKMAAIIGYLLNEQFTDPGFQEIVVTSDRYVLAGVEGDCGCNEFIGAVSDFDNNWNNLIHIPELGLSDAEVKYLEKLPHYRIRGY